jgi:phosphoribosyl 1,2-cyclic phosphate phosphodiesterase
MLREGIDRIDAVLFTHAHADHVNGIDDLRGFYFQHREMIPCYACPPTIERLMKGFGYVFHRDDGASHPPILEANTINGSFELFGLKIIPVPLIHGAGVSCGFRVDNFAYLTDCSKIPASSLALLQGVATVIIDGLRWSPHPYHFNITGAIEALHSLHPERIILTHLTHELFHAEGNRLPDGVEFAFDGMNFEL